jgi:large subunit ribosomal protein L30
MGETIKITYYRSAIGRQKVQKETVRALGFRRLNQTLEKPDNPSIRGMVHKVRHLVRIEAEDEDDNNSE